MPSRPSTSLGIGPSGALRPGPDVLNRRDEGGTVSEHTEKRKMGAVVDVFRSLQAAQAELEKRKRPDLAQRLHMRTLALGELAPELTVQRIIPLSDEDERLIREVIAATKPKGRRSRARRRCDSHEQL